MSRRIRPLHGPILNAIVFTAAAGLAGSAAAATITVNTTVDADAADGFCSLREAILAANDDLPRNECPAGDGPDRITFALPLPAEIDLTADLPQIVETLKIQGPGPLQLTIDGADLHRLLNFDTPAGGWLGVERLTLYRGRAPGGVDSEGGGAYVGSGEAAHFERVLFRENRSGNAGGGLAIGSAGSSPTSVTVLECRFLGNVSEGPGSGGGLALIGTGGEAIVIGSTFEGNEAAHENGSGGGLLALRGTLVLESSTVSGNLASSNGGGVLFQVSGVPPQSGSLVVRNSTITENVANLDGAAGDVDGDGGGIASSVGTDFTANLELVNSVVAGNEDLEGSKVTGFQLRPDLSCSGDVQLVASGASFVGVHEGCEALFPAGLPNGGGDWVGTEAAPLEPVLQPLADYGGPTPTHRPALPPTTSPLIDSGICPDAVTDQRGYGDAAAGRRRIDMVSVPDAPGSDGCDIGAVEAGSGPIVAPVLFADGFELGHTLRWTTDLSLR